MSDLKRTILLFLFLGFCGISQADIGFRLEKFDYPYPVRMMAFSSQGQSLEMAYMDVRPQTVANGKTIVLFHGKNFCAATWGKVIKALTATGYRVVAVDQVGFCKSSKPLDYQYSFHQLAANTRLLMKKLGVEHFYLMGHSMGGMLATRYALLYPEQVDGLLMVNPIGLEDWLQKGVPYITIDEWEQQQLNINAAGIKRYQQQTYYAGVWHEDFDIWVAMLAGQFDADRERSAELSARIYDMILTQPVVHEFRQLQVPVWLFIGSQDNTAVGKAFAPDEVKPLLGNYPQLAVDAVTAIPDARLQLFPTLGHSPQIQAPEQFNRALLKALGQMLNKQ